MKNIKMMINPFQWLKFMKIKVMGEASDHQIVMHKMELNNKVQLSRALLIKYFPNLLKKLLLILRKNLSTEN